MSRVTVAPRLTSASCAASFSARASAGSSRATSRAASRTIVFCFVGPAVPRGPVRGEHRAFRDRVPQHHLLQAERVEPRGGKRGERSLLRLERARAKGGMRVGGRHRPRQRAQLDEKSGDERRRGQAHLHPGKIRRRAGNRARHRERTVTQRRQRERHGARALDGRKEPLRHRAVRQRRKLPVLRCEPRQREHVEVDDLRRPEQRRSDREVRGAVTERDELASRIVLRERRPGMKADDDLAAGSLGDELRPPVAGLAERERGTDGGRELPGLPANRQRPRPRRLALSASASRSRSR